MISLPQAFDALKAFDQFIVCKNKIPLNPNNLCKINPHNSYNWMSCEQAISNANRLGEPYAIAFILTSDDPFFFIDIDHCIKLMPTVASIEVLNEFKGAAVEISQSGTGYHIIGSSENIQHRCKHKDDHIEIELYTEKRILCLTGINAYGDSSVKCDLTDFVDRYFKPNNITAHSSEWTTEPVEEWTGYADDLELIEHAKSSKSFNRDE